MLSGQAIGAVICLSLMTLIPLQRHLTLFDPIRHSHRDSKLFLYCVKNKIKLFNDSGDFLILYALYDLGNNCKIMTTDNVLERYLQTIGYDFSFYIF
jgi:hypothetical protein